MPPKKRSASMVEDSGSEPEKASKASKKVKGAKSGLGSDGKDDDGNPFWELSNKRRVGVSQFKNASFINIREYYEKDGKTLPGKKGISLSVEQYAALLKAVPAINAALSDLGHKVEGFEETTSAPVAASKSKKDKSKSSKANIDATSDEEEDE